MSQLPAGPFTSEAALLELIRTNTPAYVFQRYGHPVFIAPDEYGLSVISGVDHGVLVGMLARAIHWKADVKLPGGEIATKTILPPHYLATDILAHRDWPFPALRGTSPVPIFHKDGTVHAVAGYDPVSGYWYEPSGVLLSRPLVIPAVTPPSLVTRARDVLYDWLQDFPFAGEAERASAIAFYLTLLARTAIDGNTPLALVTATKSRTGKTLLIEAILLAVLGVKPALTSAPVEEAEWRKLLASCALAGKLYVLLDNINGPLDSAALASVLTTGMISDRLLKTNEAPDMRADFILAATGNQLEASTELLARSYRCLLDAGMSRPQDRSGFVHENLLTYTLDHRWDLLQAGYILLAHYARDGYPIKTADLPRKGGFEGWVKVIGGTLASAGIPGFLANELELTSSSDEHESALERFLAALLQVHGHTHFKVSQLYSEATNASSPLSGALPSQLSEVVASKSAFLAKAGLLLKKHRGVHFGRPDMWLSSQEDTHTKSTVWCVQGGDVSATHLEETAITAEQEEIARKLLENEGGTL